MNSGIGYVRSHSPSVKSPNGYQTIAKHVMNIHMNRPNLNASEVAGEIDIDKMKRYISYCKSYVVVTLLVHFIQIAWASGNVRLDYRQMLKKC